MELKLVSNVQEEIVRVAIDGRMTSMDFETGVRDPLETLLGPLVYARKVLLDLKKVTFIDSAAVGWLITRKKAFQSGGGALALHSIPPNVDKVFNLLKLGSVLCLASDEADAVSKVSGGGS
jgi:anti-anti-sigma factor